MLRRLEREFRNLSPLELVLLSLATYRLTMLINKEDGPYDIFTHFRTFVGVREIEKRERNEYGIEVIIKEREGLNEVADMIACPFCLSGWVSLLLYSTRKRTWLLTKWLAIWGIVALILRGED